MTSQGLVEYAKSLLTSKANTWYMYGNNGKPITEAFIQIKKKQYPDNYSDRHVAELRKHIGAIGYDCSSIMDLYTGQDKSANGWLSAASQSGPISTMPDIAGLSVHFNGHVGVYIGGGKVVEARGTWYGIVETNLKDRPWTSWAKVPGVDYGGSMLQKGDKGEAIKKWQERLMEWNSQALPRFKADGDFGGETETWTNNFKQAAGLPQDGVVDDRTWDAMVGKLKGVDQSQIDAAKAQADAEKKRADQFASQLTSERAKSASLTSELKGVAKNLIEIDKVKSKYA